MLYFFDKLIKSKIVIPACLILSFILGLAGIKQSASLANIELDWYLASYLAIQLFTFQAGTFFEPQHTHNLLNVMRFLAPFTSMATITLGAAKYFQSEIQLWIMSKKKEHIILIGETDETFYFLNSMEYDAKVIVVSKSPSERVSALCMARRYVLYESEISATLWMKIGLVKTTIVIVDTADDYNNIRIGNELLDFYNRNSSRFKEQLRVFVNIEDSKLISTLEEFDLFRRQKGKFDASIFNSAQLKSRLLLKNHPPDIYHSVKKLSDVPPTISLLIDSPTGIEYLNLLYKNCHWLNHQGTSINVFLHNAGEYKTEIEATAKKVKRWFKTNIYILETTDDCKKIFPADVVYILLSDIFRQYEIIREVVRLGVEHRCVLLADIQNDLRTTTPLFKQEHIFSLIDLSEEAISFENITRNKLDRFAIAINASYINMLKGSINEKGLAWMNLTEDKRNANRSAADHIDWKLRALGLKAVLVSNPDDAIFISEDMISRDHLILEHNRWWSEKIITGWKCTDKKKNDDLKLHPLMVEFNKLDQKDIDFDKNNYLNINTILESEGHKIIKNPKE